MWKDVESGIRNVFAKDISKQEYMVLNALIYDICTIGEPAFGKRQLHEELTAFFVSYVKDLLTDYKDLTGECLLQRYSQQWQDYLTATKIVNGICSYLNKQLQKDADNVLEVYDLSLVSWRDYLLKPLKREISSAILKLIKKERNGESVNTGLISITLNSFIEVDISIPHLNATEPNLRLYKDAFETEFLAECEVFYISESASVVQKNPVSEFMKKIEMWFHEEQKRTRLYLHESTLGALEGILENVIEKYINIFLSEFKHLLAYDKRDDLKRMFLILSRVSGGLHELNVQFENYICQQGLSSVEKFTEDSNLDIKSYIKAILEIYQKYNAIVIVVFDNDSEFAAALDKACKKFINKNAVTESGGASNKSPALLARYCDLLLKKKPSDGEEMEIIDNLNLAMVVFKYIEEKDLFQNYYSRMLAKRLILQANSFVNEDAEIIVISRLRESCGLEYTSKLQRLFQDVSVSRDLNTQFRETAHQLDIDFSINVIRSSSWPFTQTLECNLPQELERSVQLFTEFYANHYSGRKLTWLQGMSRGELVSSCFDKPYSFQASTLHVGVLLQFNSGDTFSVFQLVENTGIRQAILLQVLQALLKIKVLKLEEETDLCADSTISLNAGYSNKKLKVVINAQIKSEIKSEQDAVHTEVEENRKFLIKAAIVRIAKSRKIVEHNELLSEVLNQLSAQFKPEVSVIKKCIDILIEENYLERVENSYSYVA